MAEYPFKTKKLENGEVVVNFSKEDVKAYLCFAVEKWREKKKQAKTEEEKLIASCYIDAFLSVLYSLFGSQEKCNGG